MLALILDGLQDGWAGDARLGLAGLDPIRAATSSALYPNSVRTAWVCSPMAGAGPEMAAGVDSLDMMGLPKPAEMTGASLLRR